jgi:flagellar protein FlaG
MDVRAVSTSIINPADPGAINQQTGVSQISAIVPGDSYPSASELLHKEKYELSVSDLAFRKAIEKANHALEGIQRRFEYSVHAKTGEVIVKVINQDNNEVLREIPNEKFLDLMANLQELTGLNIDEKR